jgi:hypothetical protein
MDAPTDVTDSPMSQSCLGNWCRRKAITIHASQVVGGPHADMPVLIHLASDPDLETEARSDGFDLLFTDSDAQTRLSYERQSYVSATGELVALVRVPSVSSSADSIVYLYYGNPVATDQQDAVHTWDASYKGVWHLEETLADSTALRNDGTSSGGPTLGVTAPLGKGVGFDGIDDQIIMADSPSLDSTASAGTISVWINWVDSTTGNYQVLMSSSNRYTGDRMGIEWAVQGSGNHYFYPEGDGNGTDPYNLGPDPFTDATWQYLAVTWQYTTKDVVIYINGVAMAFSTTNAKTMWNALAVTNNWLWGGNPDFGGGYFAGMLDEIRVANTARSDGWIQTEYKNQNAPAAFYSVGPEVALE